MEATGGLLLMDFEYRTRDAKKIKLVASVTYEPQGSVVSEKREKYKAAQDERIGPIYRSVSFWRVSNQAQTKKIHEPCIE